VCDVNDFIEATPTSVQGSQYLGLRLRLRLGLGLGLGSVFWMYYPGCFLNRVQRCYACNAFSLRFLTNEPIRTKFEGRCLDLSLSSQIRVRVRVRARVRPKPCKPNYSQKLVMEHENTISTCCSIFGNRLVVPRHLSLMSLNVLFLEIA